MYRGATPPRSQPIFDRFGHEARTVLAANAPGNTVHHKQLQKMIDHILTRHALSDIQSATSLGIFSNDGKPFQRMT